MKTLPHFAMPMKNTDVQNVPWFRYIAMQRKCNRKRAKIPTIGTQRKEILRRNGSEGKKASVNEDNLNMQCNANKQDRITT